MFDISDRIEPLELSDVFYRLEELLEQDQFELIFPEDKHKNTFPKQQDISLVYLMNDAVESFLVFHNATMTGEYQKEYEGEILAVLDKKEEQYVLVVHQGDSVVTLFFDTLLQKNNLYNYGDVGHFWVKGYEYLRVLEYRLAILRDKCDYLDESCSTPEERKLASLVEFPPLNYCCYPAVPEKYIVPRENPWQPTEKAINLMLEIAKEAEDKTFIRLLSYYKKNSSTMMSRWIAYMLHRKKHIKIISILTKRLQKAASIYPNRSFGTKNDIKIQKILQKAEKRKQELKEAGITPITADDAYLTSFIGYHFARYIGQDGVKSLVTGEEYNGESVTWDDEKVKAAAESFADFAKKGYFSKNIATNKYPAGQNQEFAPGDAAIVICGSWLPNEAKDSVADDLEWGYFNYPSVPDGKDDNTANNIANQVLAINKDSKMADKAFQLIEYITTGEYDKKMTEDALCIPTDKANSDAWPTELSGVKEAFDATTTFYDWAAGVESNNDITPVLQENTQKLASGKLDAAGFIKAMKEAAGQ